MNWFWISLFVLSILFSVFITRAYYQGTQKVVKRLVLLLLSLILAGTAIRLGYILLPQSTQISYYIACIGTILFYIILTPIFKRQSYDRYQRISKTSRIFACFVALIEAWFFISYIVFFWDLFYPINNSPALDKLVDIFLLPIRFIWFFPRI